MSSTKGFQVNNNIDASRFEVRLDDQMAKIDYRIKEGIIYFLHTEVPDDLEGQGIASKMARTALEYAKAEGFRVKPWCPFVAAYIRRHPEYQSLVA